MIALTSIAPKHINEDIQEIAVASWIELGFNVYSFNGASEIELLQKKFPQVNFVEVELFNKKCKIDYLLNFARSSEESDFCMINSDIILYDTLGYMPKIKRVLPTSSVIVKRRDFLNNVNHNKVFLDGIDVFFIHKNYLHVFPPTDFVLGECWHDYQTPYALIKNNIDVYMLTDKFAYHRMHNTQYSVELWKHYAKHFAQVNGIKYRNAETLSTTIYKEIVNNSKELK
jgi:hypothetical protein